MNRILLLSTLAAAGLALSVSACDEQQASDSSSVPMQQGAMPADNLDKAAPAAPEIMEPQPEEPSATQPGSSQ